SSRGGFERKKALLWKSLDHLKKVVILQPLKTSVRRSTADNWLAAVPALPPRATRPFEIQRAQFNEAQKVALPGVEPAATCRLWLISANLEALISPSTDISRRISIALPTVGIGSTRKNPRMGASAQMPANNRKVSDQGL